MKPLNPKSASSLCWFALVVNGLGLIVTALSAQFAFSAFAAILALIPTVLARSRSQIFGVIVLALSLALAFTGYPKYEQEKARIQQRVKAGHDSEAGVGSR
jgi:membrane protein implicated in regulation of membrane protease activity